MRLHNTRRTRRVGRKGENKSQAMNKNLFSQLALKVHLNRSKKNFQSASCRAAELKVFDLKLIEIPTFHEDVILPFFYALLAPFPSLHVTTTRNLIIASVMKRGASAFD